MSTVPEPGPRRRRRRGAPGATAACLGWCLGASTLALLVIGCSGPGDAREGLEEEALPAVEAVPARFGTLPLEETLSGIVKARNQVSIRPEIEAPVVDVLVRNGERIERGQPLVRLEADPVRDRLRQAEANLRLTEATAAEARARMAEIESRVVRTRALAAENLVSESELETLEAQLDAARAQAQGAAARVEQAEATVEERRSDLSQTVVRSPVAGRVGRRNAEVGMLVDPNTVLFLVGDFDDLIVEVPLTEAMLGSIEEGTPVRIESPAAEGEPIRAAVDRISPFLEEGSFSTIGEIDVDNRDGRLRPGMFVTVTVLYGETERATLIPASALWEDPDTGRRGVFVVATSEGLAEPEGKSGKLPPEARTTVFRTVDPVAEGRGVVAVRGLDEGEWVVTVGHHLLNEAMEAGSAAAGEAPAAGDRPEVEARVRATSWERVLELQGLQREDLLMEFLDKQQAIARVLGAELPESESVVDEILAREDEDGGGAGPAPGRAPEPPGGSSGEGG